MIKFLLKKNFVDGWDNMFQIILFNLLLLALCIGGYFAIFIKKFALSSKNA